MALALVSLGFTLFASHGATVEGYALNDLLSFFGWINALDQRILRGASPTWAGGARHTPACASPPCLDPLLLLDAAETERHVEAFPFADYEQHVVRRPLGLARSRGGCIARPNITALRYAVGADTRIVEMNPLIR